MVVMDHRLGAMLPAVRNDEVLEKEKRVKGFGRVGGVGVNGVTFSSVEETVSRCAD